MYKKLVIFTKKGKKEEIIYSSILCTLQKKLA